jgi:CheY-like chemotaxis protein
MDGFEVARRLRQQPGLEHALLAAVSGYGQEEHRRQSKLAGFDRHLVKPSAWRHWKNCSRALSEAVFGTRALLGKAWARPVKGGPAP